MGKEIERKFLVDLAKWNQIKPDNGLLIQQGYIVRTIEKTVRVRTIGNQGFLTIKGETDGISRLEFEYKIPLEEANELLQKFCKKTIQKTRFIVHHQEHEWEVDEFISPKKGMVLAEVELKNVDEHVSLPSWISKEVSDDPSYYNANMIDES